MLWIELILIIVLHLCRTMLFSDEKEIEQITVQRSAARWRLTRSDVLWMTGICVVYGLIAFYQIGVGQNPVTECRLRAGEILVLDFGESSQAAKLNWYVKNTSEKVFLAETGMWDDASGEILWNDAQEISVKYVFNWGRRTLNVPGQYLRLSGFPENMALTELVIQDAQGESLLPETVSVGDAWNQAAGQIQEQSQEKNAWDQAVGQIREQSYEENAGDTAALFDEQVLLPEQGDYRNSAYFDEIYHVRTAYEFLTGETAYENTHPPLGKILIAAGIALFGMAPFGFRFMGVLFGILMLPFLYLLVRAIVSVSEREQAEHVQCERRMSIMNEIHDIVSVSARRMAAFGSLLFACDFMHFTQTRVATIDVYITFFTIVMFYFMFQYTQMSFYDTPLRRTFLPLGACGIAFGLGISCKWTGFYAGAGLAVLFFLTLYRRYREYRLAVQRPEGSSSGISHASIRACFKSYTVKTIGFCLIFFVLIPFVIYLLSYLPFRDGTDTGLLERMWENQKSMFRYHSRLRAEHPYSSSWYEWPVMLRPILYYYRTTEDAMKQGISAFGNPLVWWAGIPAFFHMLYLWLRPFRGMQKKRFGRRYTEGCIAAEVSERDGTAGFLCIAYLACFLPWILVERCTFIYHYFPSVPFIVCMIVYSLAQWRKRLGERGLMVLIIVYSIGALALFVMFYPVLSGMSVPEEYVEKVLRWMSSWDLVR